MKILVAGAGISGIAVAALLHKQGHTITVIDKRLSTSNQGYALSVWKNGQSVLKQVGAYQSLVKKGLFIKRFHVFNRTATLASIHLTKSVGISEPLLIVDRTDLRNSLLARVPSSSIRFGMTIERFHEHHDGVTVFFTNKTKERFDFIIAADGVNSPIRKKLFPEVQAKSTGITGFLVWIPGMRSVSPELVTQWGSQRYLGILPHQTSGRITCYFALPTKSIYSRHSWQLFLREQFSSFGKPCSAMLKRLPKDNAAYFRHDHVLLSSEHLYSKRVVFIGDAAHASSPFLGQGASVALEDASALAYVLTKTKGTSLKNLQKTFRSYTAARAKRSKQVARETNFSDAIVRLPGFLSVFRDYGMKLFYPLSFGKNMKQFIEEWKPHAPTRN